MLLYSVFTKGQFCYKRHLCFYVASMTNIEFFPHFTKRGKVQMSSLSKDMYDSPYPVPDERITRIF